ncbi:MAG: efflux RND transporter periplasmic adaptor subunit [Gammaproteobacteria bacterium]|jgi:HlyD family secretion protein
MNKRIKFLLPLLLILIAAGTAGYLFWHRADNNDTGNTLTLHGNVDIRQVQLAFNGSERISDMRFQEGDRVKKGDLLASLDKTRLQHATDQAAARVAAQRQVVAKLKAGTRPEEIRQLRAEVEAARITAANAERTSRRLAELTTRKLASQEQADNARAAADAGKAKLRAVEESLRLAEAGPRKEDIAAAEAILKADQAQLALVRRQLADADLYAPAAGVIQDRLLEPGDMATPQRPVYTLALTNPLWVRAYVGETDLGRIHPGMRASVHTDSFPEKSYDGWIGFISPTAEFTPKSVETREVRTDLVYQVRVFVCNPQNQLRLGMPAVVTIDMGQVSAENATQRRPCGDR